MIEIGAGNGYWAKLLQIRGVDIIPYDIHPKPKHFWTTVFQGTPNVISNPEFINRNLLLCFPDEQESIAFECLELFQGEYIIHIGETIHNGTFGGVPQAPFGRTTSGDFQLALSATFHCVLVADLQMKLPYSNDCISVWRRTKFVIGRLPLVNNETSSLPQQLTKNKVNLPINTTKNDNTEAVEFISMEELEKMRNPPVVSSSIPKSTKQSNNRSMGSDVSKSASISLPNTNNSSSYQDSSDCVSFISIKELEKLRGEEKLSADRIVVSTTKTHARKGTKELGSKTMSTINTKTLSSNKKEIEKQSREAKLDRQYYESDEKRWAHIPSNERLPIDRAAPYLQHLLDFRED